MWKNAVGVVAQASIVELFLVELDEQPTLDRSSQ
jgi:hypothetical protein